MGRGWDKITTTIRQQDLFGIPVQLTFKGQREFKTCFSGCISIAFVLTFVVYFCLELNSNWRNPNFLHYPATQDFEVTKVKLLPMTGSTVAVAIKMTDDFTKLKSAESAMQI